MNKTEKKLPIIYLMIDESIDPDAPKENGGDGFSAVSLVRNPAIETDFMTFSSDGKAVLKFKTTDKEKRIVTGPLLIAGKEIYRNDPKMGEFMAIFDSDTIEKVAQKFMREKKTDSVTLEHQMDIPSGVYLCELWLVSNPEIDKSKAMGFEGITEGSLMASYKIDNEEIWNDYIKTGKVRGFSIEGIFNLVRPKDFTKMASMCLSERSLNRVKLKKVLLEDFIRKTITKKAKVKYERFTGGCNCRNCLELKALGWMPYSSLPETLSKEVKIEQI